MIEILQTFGLPAVTVIGVAAGGYLLREVFRMIQATRMKTQQDVLATVLAELDAQLSDFYMPLSARFRVSRLLFQTTREWQAEGKYSNDQLAIKSDDEKALRNLVVRRVFMPLNAEVERLLLEKGHLATTDDTTSYPKILERLILWRSLEEAVCDGTIDDYEAAERLQFPVEEVAKCLAYCDDLLAMRNSLRADLLRMRVTVNHALLRKRKGKETKE